MKLLYGGSAAIAATLLAATVLFNARPLAAEPAAQTEPSRTQQQKEDTPDPIDLPETKKVLDAGAIMPPINAPASVTHASDKPPGANLTLETPPALVPASAEAAPVSYIATAYNLRGRTASGRLVNKGIIAADPSVLPLGTRVRLDAGPYSGEYLVADTGSAVRGRKIDVWVPSYREARRFGRRKVKLIVLSYGKRRGAKKAK